MTKDKIWLISAIVCFLAAVVSLARSAIVMSDTCEEEGGGTGGSF